jgi:hypothetical protein
MVLDTDTVFHGVDRIADVAADELPRIRPGTTLDYLCANRWTLRSAEGEHISQYDWTELRFSVSWKAYCFANEHERDTWRDHSDDLTLDVILTRLVADLVARGRLESDVTRDAVLGQLLIDEYIRFPLLTS